MKILTEKQRLKICDNCEYHIRSPQTDKIVNWDVCALGDYITERTCDKHLEYQSALSELETLKRVKEDVPTGGAYAARRLRELLEQAQTRCRELGLGE